MAAGGDSGQDSADGAAERYPGSAPAPSEDRSLLKDPKQKSLDSRFRGNDEREGPGAFLLLMRGGVRAVTR